MAESDRDHSYNHQASSELSPVPGLQHVVDPSNWESLEKLLTGFPDEDNGICDNMVDNGTILLYSPNSSNFGDDETACTNSRVRATLEMNFITMILADSNCFRTSTGTMILAMLKQLAYSKAYPEYDMAKHLTDQVEARKQLVQPKVQFCDSKERELQELAELKMRIEARHAAILAEIHGAIKETEPIQAQLKKLLLQQDQFKENEGNLKTILDIGDGLWTTLKNIIHRHLPT